MSVWPSCKACPLPAIVAVQVAEDDIELACWYCGRDAMIFQDGRGKWWCDLLDEVPWLKQGDA